jgi:L-threonylcarbamoyladenylate synthase
MDTDRTQSLSAAAAADSIAAGGLLVFPTDTVWGLGGDPRRAGVVARMAAIKGRREARPFALLLDDAATAARLTGTALPAGASAIAARYWPGPLTLILASSVDARSVGCDESTAADWRTWITPLGEIGLRVPAPVWLRDFIAACGGMLAATSANFGGRPAPGNRAQLEPDLLQRCDGLWCPAGASEALGVPSTVVRVAHEKLDCVREGAIAWTDLDAVFSLPLAR